MVSGEVFFPAEDPISKQQTSNRSKQMRLKHMSRRRSDVDVDVDVVLTTVVLTTDGDDEVASW